LVKASTDFADWSAKVAIFVLITAASEKTKREEVASISYKLNRKNLHEAW